MTHADVALIGAGPIGIEMAVALQRQRVNYLHFDAGQIGQTISWFAPQTRFFSSNERIAIAGVPLQTVDQGKATREDYLRYLRTVVQLYDLPIRTYEPVTAISRDGGGFFLHTAPAAGPQRYRVDRLILATGGTARPRKLNVPGEDLPHVHAYFQDPHTYFRRRLLIVGGRNSAVEAALRCHQAGATVSISYRRAGFDAASIKYWLLPEINGLIEAGRIRGLFNTSVEQIHPAEVVLRDAQGRRQTLDADFVLPLIGYVADMSLCRMAGVELHTDCERPVFDEQTMQTNVPGVYVAGTAVGGTQEHYRVFIENCHIHVQRIVAALTGQSPPVPPRPPARPES